ncbi:MAG TPA: hypothetical protein VFM18_22230 [Methanosarcina sp.]|nr:hypothetical protein [Methanosarcina sp.]
MARDVVINGVQYSVSKIDDVFEQTYLASRFAPILGGMAEGNVSALFEKVGTLNKDALKEIYFGLLKGVKRRNESGTWSPVCADNRMMFQDISMADGFNLCKESFMENFESFLAGSGLNLAAQNPTA